MVLVFTGSLASVVQVPHRFSFMPFMPAHLPSAWSAAGLMAVKGIFSSAFRFVCVLLDGERKWKNSQMFRCRRKEAVVQRENLMVASFTPLLWPKKMVCRNKSQTISDIHFSEEYPCTPFLSPIWKQTQDNKNKTKLSTLTVFHAEDRTSFGGRSRKTVLLGWGI